MTAAPLQYRDTLYPLKVQWKGEHRYLSGEKQRIEQRIKELEDMLESFFGKDGKCP